MTQTFKALSVLLEYPVQEFMNNMADVKAAIEQEALVPAKVRGSLFSFMDELAKKPILESQEEYVALFDRSRLHSLYLFEHIHGESRDRGQAMIDLIDQYRLHGFEITSRELPDYLPLFLEFLNTLSVDVAQSYLGEVVHIIAAIEAKLKDRKQPYHVVFKALESLTSAKVDEKFVEQAVTEARSTDTSLEALDREWEETPAFDGTGESDCGTCPQATRHPEQTYTQTNQAG